MFPAQVNVKNKFIKQHVTKSKCLSNVYLKLNIGHCPPQDCPKKIIVWLNLLYEATDFYSLRKFNVHKLRNYIIFLSL